nr:Chain E, p1-p6 peptide [Human immunodeficiency virus 1]4OBF_F Chain F, p1-p6 peptide [Human immunodeficiency virus 1]4OBJ_C Chain C, p1-p6 peptide [Human immunodeficiency virus 1]
RPGNFLQNRP